MNFKAVMFDLDGTLLDTIEDIAEAVNTVLRALNSPTYEIADYKRMVGDGMRSLAERVLPPEMQDKEIIDQCVKLARSEFTKRWSNKTKPYDGIPEMLNELTKRKIRLAVLSNKPDDLTKLTVAKYLPEWHFEIVIGARDGINPKPDAVSAIEIAKSMKLAPEDFLYLGDTDTDMKTAVNAGMYPVGVLWGFREAEELLKNGAKVLIKKPQDLLEII